MKGNNNKQTKGGKMEALIKQLENDDVLELTRNEASDLNDLQEYIINNSKYDLDDFRMSRQDGIISVWLA